MVHHENTFPSTSNGPFFLSAPLAISFALLLFYCCYAQVIQIRSFTFTPCSQDSIQGTCAHIDCEAKEVTKGLYHLTLRLRLTSQGILLQTPDTFTTYSAYLEGQIWQLEDTFSILHLATKGNFRIARSYFIPHYSLKLDSGKQELRGHLIRLHLQKWDTLSRQFSDLIYKVEGETESSFSVFLSPFLLARICLDTIEVAPYDHTYNNWDESLFLPTETYPDIQVQIVGFQDVRFQFPVFQNTFLTSYSRKCSPWLHWRKDDRMQIRVCDRDLDHCHEIDSLSLHLNETEWKSYHGPFLRTFQYKVERKE
jgi:hypothetical protein